MRTLDCVTVEFLGLHSYLPIAEEGKYPAAGGSCMPDIDAAMASRTGPPSHRYLPDKW
jgi:hypothetical protein